MATIPQGGTLVLLMGLGPAMAAGLLRAGWSPETPAAAIEQGTTRRQRTVVASLATLADAPVPLRPPTLIVVGETVRLRDTLDWFDLEQVMAGGFAASAPAPRTPVAVWPLPTFG